MHLHDGLTQPLGGCRRKASNNMADHEGDDGMTWTCLYMTGLTLNQSMRLGDHGDGRLYHGHFILYFVCCYRYVLVRL